VIKLQNDERRALSDYIQSICAIQLDESKAYLIEGRLGGLVEENRCSSFGEFLLRARSDTSGALKRRVIDSITTGETLFFRDSAPFDLLRNKIIPEIVDRRMRSGSTAPIRVWSAACSTGQEIYSIAITLRETIPDPNRIGFRLLGTDISDQAIARASKGMYTAVEVARGLSDSVRSKYFVSRKGGWQVCDQVRAMASFKRLNLMEDFSALGKFDIVFCRNVAIYFSDADRISLFRRIEQRMERDAYLLVGALESLSGACPQFESKRYLRSIFYQLKTLGA
jgi:chemotaxis protein methyltransferase CheR